MKKVLTSTLFALWMLAFVFSGCSGLYIKTESPNGEKRTVTGFSVLTDRQIEKMHVETKAQGGGSFDLDGAKSDQSKALDVAKAAIEAIPK
jgi:hypothetical protein